MQSTDGVVPNYCQGRCYRRVIGSLPCDHCNEGQYKFEQTKRCFCILIPCRCCTHHYPKINLNKDQICNKCKKCQHACHPLPEMTEPSVETTDVSDIKQDSSSIEEQGICTTD